MNLRVDRHIPRRTRVAIYEWCIHTTEIEERRRAYVTLCRRWNGLDSAGRTDLVRSIKVDLEQRKNPVEREVLPPATVRPKTAPRTPWWRRFLGGRAR